METGRESYLLMNILPKGRKLSREKQKGKNRKKNPGTSLSKKVNIKTGLIASQNKILIVHLEKTDNYRKAKLIMQQMIHYKTLLFISLLVVSISSFSSNETDKLLKELDDHLVKKQTYFNEKKLRIHQLTTELVQSEKQGQYAHAYDLSNSLLDEYESFSYDSAFRYVTKVNALAVKLGNPDKIALSKIKMGFSLLSSGLFKESLDTLKSIKTSQLPENIRKEYFNVIARTYYDLADYDGDEFFASHYRKTGSTYLDSAITSMVPSSSEYWSAMGLRRMKAGDYPGSADAFNYLITKFKISDHTYAIATSSLGYLYSLMGRQNEAIDMLIHAAIADIV